MESMDDAPSPQRFAAAGAGAGLPVANPFAPLGPHNAGTAVCGGKRRMVHADQLEVRPLPELIHHRCPHERRRSAAQDQIDVRDSIKRLRINSRCERCELARAPTGRHPPAEPSLRAQ